MKTKIQVRLFFLLIAVIAATGCSKQDTSLDQDMGVASSKIIPDDPKSYGAIEGIIQPWIKGTTIYAANALYQSQAVETDENGYFRIENLNSGIYNLFINYEQFGLPVTFIVEGVRVKPLSTNYIGVIYIE